MLPCGEKPFLYDPFVKYCKRNEYVGICDPSMCLLGKDEWERHACSLYCDHAAINKEVGSDGTVWIWQIVSGILLAIVIGLIVAIVCMCNKNRNRNPTPANHTASAPPMPEETNNHETSVLLPGIPDESSSLESDSAVGSCGSGTTVNGEQSLNIPPQNNHEDPHTQRESRAKLAVTGKAQNNTIIHIN